jgi:deoxyribose-phosphate aldolase
LDHLEEPTKYLEHILLTPELSHSDIAQACHLARSQQIAAVTVRPCDVDLAVNWMKGSSVVLGTVVDWPLGHSTTSVKTYAVRDMLRRGAREIETVLSTGMLISRQFQYLEVELAQMADACRQSGAMLKLSIQTALLDEELKIIACRIAKRAGVDYVSAESLENLGILKDYLRDRVRLKCAAPVSTYEDFLRFRAAGCERLNSVNAGAIIEGWKRATATQSPQAPVIS